MKIMEKKEQIHLIEKWICEQSKGGLILKIGCSQGVDSGFRGGDRADGIDLSEQSLQCVNPLRGGGDPSDCRCSNVMKDDVEDESFDSVIVRNVFQYGADSRKVVEKAFEWLKEDGRLVITVSYDSDCSLKLFYATEVCQFQTESLQMLELKFFDNAIGAVFKKVSGAWPLHRDLNSIPITMEEAWQQEKQANIDRIMKNIYLQEHLEAAYLREEKLLISYKELLRKYQALSNSKLGKFALYYWKKRRSLFGGKSSG